jgi:hypothetical protein
MDVKSERIDVLKNRRVLLLSGLSFEYEYYNHAHSPMHCPVGAGCCQLGKMPCTGLHLLSNNSLIDERMDYVRYVLPDPNLNDIPAHNEADNTDTIATWVVASLLACLIILLIGIIIWNGYKNRWNKPGDIQLAKPVPMLQPSVYKEIFT